MKFFFIICFSLLLSSAHGQQSADTAFEIVNEMANMDRHQRMRIAETIQEFGASAPQVLESWERIAQMDSLHGLKLMEIHHRHGFGRFISKGGQTSHELWLLVMHQDHNILIQQELLKAMKSQMRRGNVILRDLAFLEDRVAVNIGEPQLYGTQTYLDKKKNRYVPFEMKREGVKKRRERMSLKPLKKQLKEENKRHQVKF